MTVQVKKGMKKYRKSYQSNSKDIIIRLFSTLYMHNYSKSY